MTDHKRLTGEELAEIRKRAQEAAEGNPLRDSGAMVKMYDSIDDIPKLLAEVYRLRDAVEFYAEENGKLERMYEGMTTQSDARYEEMRKLRREKQQDFAKHKQEVERLKAEVERLRRRDGLIEFYKGYADRFSDDIAEYKTAIRNLDALADSVRYRIGSQQDAEDVADEIVGIISELERKVGEIT